MADALRSEILVRARPDMRGMLLVAGVSTAFCVAAAMSAHVKQTRHSSSFVPAPVIVEADTSTSLAVAEPAQPLPSDQLQLLFTAGGATYMKLATVTEDEMPRHGKVKRSTTDYIEAAVAVVERDAMPLEHRHWEGRKVIVDNTCETTVTGFAIVSRLTGDTGYAGIDGKWTAGNVLASGSAVLAARLAGCTGTFARDATLAPVIIPTEIEDAELARYARATLLAMTPAYVADAPKQWWDLEDVQYVSKIVRHPTTGVTWVSMHAHLDHGCGGPQVNVLGLFHVRPNGELGPGYVRTEGDLWSIDKLIDIDNDGALELIGKPWLGLDTVVTRGSGEELDRLSLAFFGCPC
jgi:hypothetical protein